MPDHLLCCALRRIADTSSCPSAPGPVHSPPPMAAGQTRLFCPCGSLRLFCSGWCRSCYWRQAHSCRRFAGHREDVLDGDRHRCRACGSDWRVAVHPAGRAHQSFLDHSLRRLPRPRSMAAGASSRPLRRRGASSIRIDPGNCSSFGMDTVAALTQQMVVLRSQVAGGGDKTFLMRGMNPCGIGQSTKRASTT